MYATLFRQFSPDGDPAEPSGYEYTYGDYYGYFDADYSGDYTSTSGTAPRTDPPACRCSDADVPASL